MTARAYPLVPTETIRAAVTQLTAKDRQMFLNKTIRDSANEETVQSVVPLILHSGCYASVQQMF